MKSQIVILKVAFDENTSIEPKNWNWSEILGCDRGCVDLLNYGAVEDVDGSFSQEGSKK